MEEMYLHSSRGKYPSIFDEDICCPYCSRNHKLNENGRIPELMFVGTSTAGMTSAEAERLGADFAVKSKEAIEFYKHKG